MSVFITRGMRLSIPAGGLKIGLGPDGSEASSVRFQVGISLFPIWLEVALRHLREAVAANALLVSAHGKKESDGIARALEDEFTHGMQSITASATAIDAFYASMKNFANFAADELAAMGTNRTSRPVRIKETLRRVFRLEASPTAQLV